MTTSEVNQTCSKYLVKLHILLYLQFYQCSQPWNGFAGLANGNLLVLKNLVSKFKHLIVLRLIKSTRPLP